MRNPLQIVREMPQDTFDRMAEGLRANADKQTTGVCFTLDGCMCAAGAMMHTLGGVGYGDYAFAPDEMRSIFGLDQQEGFNFYTFVYALNDHHRLTFEQFIQLFTAIRDDVTNWEPLPSHDLFDIARDTLNRYQFS